MPVPELEPPLGQVPERVWVLALELVLVLVLELVQVPQRPGRLREPHARSPFPPWYHDRKWESEARQHRAATGQRSGHASIRAH